MPEDLETRTVMTPRTGTKICILVGLAFIVAAFYFYFTPVTSVRTTTGSIFGCGSAAHPPSSTFSKNTCGGTVDVERYRAFASGAIGIVTIALGAVMFGVDRKTETRPMRRPMDDRPRPSERYRDERDERPDRDDDEPRRDRDDDEPRRGLDREDKDQSRARRRPSREWDDADDPR